MIAFYIIITVVLLTVKTTTSLDVYETQGKETKEKPKCIPFKIYKSNDILCKCDKDGNWPNEECEWTFKIFNSIPSKDKRCKPYTYVKVNDCKICRCNEKGKIDDIYCTDNCPASRQSKRRSSRKLDSVYGSCLPKNWYSLAPCQFCYCVEVNKLVCNTGNLKHSTMLELGSYNLTICGTDFIKEAIELVPGGERTLLREGNFKNKNAIKPFVPKVVQFQTVTPKTKATPAAAPKLQIQVNRESNEKNENGNDKVDYYSDSEEKREPNLVKGISRQGLSTQQPYEEDEDDRNSNESNELNGDDDRQDETTLANDDNEEIIINSQATPRDKEALRQLFSKNPTKNIGRESKQEVFKINLPTVLDKIFNMALRKSMVKLNNNTNCEPGITQKINCNLCFCLTNGKMLCTDKAC